MFNVSLSVAYLVSFHEWWLMCFLQCTSFTPKHKDPRLNELHIKLSEKNQVFSSPPTPNSIVLWWPSTTKEYRYNDSNAVLGALYCNIHSFLTRLFIILKRTLLYKANTLYILEHSRTYTNKKMKRYHKLWSLGYSSDDNAGTWVVRYPKKFRWMSKLTYR